MGYERRVKLATTIPYQEVGRAIKVTVPFYYTPTGEQVDKEKTEFIPLSCCWELHPDHVVVDEWIALKKGLAIK